MATGDAPAEVATELPEIVKTIQDAVSIIYPLSSSSILT